jgi:hypothetical protein
MRISELKENIRGIIRKKMDEANALVTTKTGTKPVDYKNTTELAKLKSDPNVSSIETTAGQKLKEAGEYTMDKIYKMNRAELIDFAGLTPQEAAKYSIRALQSIALEMADDKPSDKRSIEEKDFMDDDDNTIIEDVEDVDSSGDGMAKYYDEIYEIEANVAPGSRYQIEVSRDGNFLILKQDNGYEIIVHPDDVKDLVKIILQKYNEIQ